MEEGRVDWTGRYFLLRASPGRDLEPVIAGARSVLGKRARRLGAAAEAEKIASWRAGEPWMRAGEARRMSRREAEVLADRLASSAAGQARLGEEDSRRLEEVVREEMTAAFDRAHAAGGDVERLGSEFPAFFEGVGRRIREFLTEGEVSLVEKRLREGAMR